VPRTVRLVLCHRADPGAGGEVGGGPEPAVLLGVLPAFEVRSPWWPDVQEVTATARSLCRAEVTVLRVIGPGRPHGPGPSDSMNGDPPTNDSPTTYLTEVLGPVPPEVPRRPVPADLADVLRPQPGRAHWAEPGGIARALSWADATLTSMGRPRTGRAEQIKTWNLSLLMRLPTGPGPVWLKCAPPFMAHEGAIIERVAVMHPDLVPQVLGRDGVPGATLMAEIPGADQWDAPPDRLEAMLERFIGLQDHWSGQVPDLLAAGLPDWRTDALVPALRRLVSRADVRRDLARHGLGPDGLARLDELVADLPRRAGDLAACGLPDTLVHGDLHPGNWHGEPADGRRSTERPRLLDWGDSGVGHPMLDQPAFLGRVPADQRDQLRRVWARHWVRRHPDADTARAGDLIGPLALLRQALVYQGFLDAIEPDERRYHLDDVARCVALAVGRAPPRPIHLGPSPT
jgi:hypothetical protein